MAYQTVQFTTLEQVAGAYVSNGVPSFCIRNKEQMLFSYKGKDLNQGEAELREFLKLLSNSSGIYSVCVFEKLDEGNRITNKTPYDGSFNFRFQNEIQAQGAAYYSREVMSELNALKEEIRQLKEEKEDAENGESEGVNGIVGSVLKFAETQPGQVIVGALVEKFMGWLNKTDTKQIEQPGEANVSQIRKVSGIETTALPEQMIEDLQALCLAANDFPELLHKLAMMAEKKPFNFKMYAAMLRTLKI